MSNKKLSRKEIEIEQLLKKARKDNSSYYYNQVLELDFRNYEADIYQAYYNAYESNSYSYKLEFRLSLSRIADNFDIKKEKETRELLKRINVDIKKLTDKYIRDMNDFYPIIEEFCRVIEKVANKIEKKEDRIPYYKMAIAHLESYINSSNSEKSIRYKNVIVNYHEMINEIDPTHSVPARPQHNDTATNDGCSTLAFLIVVGVAIFLATSDIATILLVGIPICIAIIVWAFS